MKKLIILAAMLLIGTASVFAQWDCDVTWSYDQNADCQPSNLPSQGTYEIQITLQIYDVANSVLLTSPYPVNTEDLTATSTNFSAAQCEVEDYCEDSHNNTPSFTVIAVVEFVETTTSETYCWAHKTETGLTCNDFYNTVEVEVVFN